MRLSQLCLISLLLSGSISAYSADAVLPEGTPVRMQIMRTLSSASANEGDKVDFQTLDDVSSDGIVVIPKGSRAIATITNAEPKKRMARGGKLSLNIDYVTLPDHEKLPLRGVQNLKGGGHTGAMTAGMVVTAIVVWPAAPFFLFMHGKDVSIPEGHEVTVYTTSDYRPKQINAEQEVKQATRSTGKSITNTDVLSMKSAGLSDDLVIRRIKMSSGNYNLEPDDLTYLKKAGLSDGVISAMMTAAVQ